MKLVDIDGNDLMGTALDGTIANWDEIDWGGAHYETECYVCKVQFGFKTGHPVGNLRLIWAFGDFGDQIVVPACSEQCHMAIKALYEISK